MIRYAMRRIPSALLVLFLASIVVFALIHLAKGDPAALAAGPDASPAEIAAKRHQLGLDVSLSSQYLNWLRDVLTGHLGNAYISGASIGELVRCSVNVHGCLGLSVEEVRPRAIQIYLGLIRQAVLVFVQVGHEGAL